MLLDFIKGVEFGLYSLLVRNSFILRLNKINLHLIPMFFAQYEPTVKATIILLKQFKVKVNDTTVNETLHSHPDWPSLLCVSDALQKWNVPNAAGKLDPADIVQLPVPFMAEIKNRETSLVVVTEITGSTISYIAGNKKKKITERREEFEIKWTGIYLLAEPLPESGEKGFKQKRQNALVKSILPLALMFLLFGLSFIALQHNLTGVAVASSYATGIYLQYFILAAGGIISALLLWYEIDNNNPLLKKVCTGIAKGNCSAILTGKAAKLTNWLSWSEVGFFYFTGSLLVLTLSMNESSVSIISWISILTLPYIIFSLNYQWKVAKQWCVLCLGVQVLLLLGGINVIVNSLTASSVNLPFNTFVMASLLYLLPIVAWYIAKPYLLQLQKEKNTKREYLRIKFNNEVFDTLLKKQKQITAAPDGLGIILGNPDAKYELIKVCNPYCGPCATAHPEIEKILEENKEVKARIIFMATNDEKDYRKDAVKHLLAIAEENKEPAIKKALNDWYLAPKKDYNVFASKYPMNGELKKQECKIDEMSKWCTATEIAYTPTIFINGYQLPGAYNLGDLTYFLAE